MATADISLTSGMRNSLLAMQGIARSIDHTEVRLSTGRKVNSALDNPTNFFAAQSHLNRAGDLQGRKDAIKEAVQNISAANNGVTAILTLLESAGGLAKAALSSNDQTERDAFAVQYDETLSQLDSIAADSGYRGTNLLVINLLGSQSLTVNFSETFGQSTLTITGVDASSSGLKAKTTTTNPWTSTANIQTALDGLKNATDSLRYNSEQLRNSSSVLTTRLDFTAIMSDILQNGADKLTLADMNEEGANMLMLQTRQSLGTTSLSLGARAAQTVMRLF